MPCIGTGQSACLQGEGLVLFNFNLCCRICGCSWVHIGSTCVWTPEGHFVGICGDRTPVYLQVSGECGSVCQRQHRIWKASGIPICLYVTTCVYAVSSCIQDSVCSTLPDYYLPPPAATAAAAAGSPGLSRSPPHLPGCFFFDGGGTWRLISNRTPTQLIYSKNTPWIRRLLAWRQTSRRPPHSALQGFPRPILGNGSAGASGF